MGTATLLLLADGRFPAGGHAHSGGLEAAVADSRVRDLESLRGFLSGRLATSGLVAAAFAAYACAHPVDLDSLELALDARTPSKALRNAARKQGRSLCRAARVAWPSATFARVDDISQPIALGVVAAAAGLGPIDAATVMAYTTVTGPAGAAIRLLGLDPYEVNALVAALGPACDETAARAVTFVDGPIDALPANAAPLLDISAEDHAAWEVRLFAS
jgi:urease accessory protein